MPSGPTHPILQYGPLVLFAVVVLLGVLFGWRDMLRISPRRVWALSGVCFKESIRRRVLWITPLAILGMIVVSQLTNPVDAQDAVRQTIKFCLFAAGTVVTITAIVLASTSLPKEIETRVIYTVVTKPTTRLEIVLGKILGFARVSAAILLIMGLATYAYLKARTWRLHAAIDARLKTEPKDSAAYATLAHWSSAGLLSTSKVEQAAEMEILARAPKNGQPHWMAGSAGQFFIAPFDLSRQQADAAFDAINNEGATALFVVNLPYQRNVPTAEEAELIEQMNLPTDAGPIGPSIGFSKPIPQIIFQVLDKNMTRLAQAEVLAAVNLRGELKNLKEGNDVVTLPPNAPDGRPRPTRIFMEGKAVEAVLNARRFNLSVGGRTPAVEYAVDDKVASLVVAYPDPNRPPMVILPNYALNEETAAPSDEGAAAAAAGKRAADGPGQPGPRVYSSAGRYGMQVGGAEGRTEPTSDGPVAVYHFRDADLGSAGGGGGTVTLEVRAGIERSGDGDVEGENLPTVAVRVRDRATDAVSDAVVFQTESNRTSYVRVPRSYFPAAGKDFDVLVRVLTPGQYLGVKRSSVLVAAGQRWFAVNLFKGLLVLWLMAVLVVSIAVFCSTFVSWPIAVVLTLVLLLGRWGVEQVGDAAAPGLGAEVTNSMGLDPASGKVVKESVDFLTWLLPVIAAFLPDISAFGSAEMVERGISIPPLQMFGAAWVLLGYGLPMVLLAYLILKVKEVAP